MYKVGIAGSGFGVRAHLPAFSLHPEFEVVALASPHSAQRVAGERGIPNAFSSCAELLKGCEVDVMSVAGPPFTHHDDVIAALAAGKHVVCEKPFAQNVAQAEEMLAATQRAGTATAVMHEFRWVPQRLAVKELIDNNHLSPLREIEITQLSNRLRSDVERTRSWWFDRERGGGMAGALLSHLIDSANWLAGRAPIRSTGYLRTANPQRRDAQGTFTSTVDDGCWALIDYGNGLVARVSVDAATSLESFTLAAHGENRTAVASGTDFDTMRLFSVDDEETNELDVKPSPYGKFASVDRHVPFIMELLDEFVKQIRTGSSAVPTFEEAVATQRVLASIGYGA
ncbi:MAG TPA: Gfo/Idh/MocA family oxidoreductase [Candidatus Baltobacteraceae bacterium]|nr:Gfo/Idh/MocA family oxidoreductase [Candidatus Baltobacteraceae bacterium]